jgi:hypothetical protein
MSLKTSLKNPFGRRLDPRRGSDQAFTSVEAGGPAVRAGWEDHPPRKGFFTDTSICIGCKACEVACKEWNGVPQDGIFELLGSSYDNTGSLGASTWRHVEFIEQRKPGRPPGSRSGCLRPRRARACSCPSPVPAPSA